MRLQFPERRIRISHGLVPSSLSVFIIRYIPCIVKSKTVFYLPDGGEQVVISIVSGRDKFLMSTDAKSRATDALTSAQPDKPVFRDGAQETADRAILAGAPVDHTLGNRNAALTETEFEKSIDAANGLRGAAGHTPTAEDFDGLLTPEGDSGDTVGKDISNRTLVFGDDGTL